MLGSSPSPESGGNTRSAMEIWGSGGEGKDGGGVCGMFLGNQRKVGGTHGIPEHEEKKKHAWDDERETERN